MERQGGFPDGSVPGAATFLPGLRRAGEPPPEIAASGALDGVLLVAAVDALPAPMPAAACAEKSAARVRAVLAPDGKEPEFPVREPAPCTPGAVRSAA